MPTLPQGSLLTEETASQLQPSWTFHINPNTQRLEGTTDGIEAVQQAIEILFHVERYRYPIYAPSSGIQLEDLLGQDRAYAMAQLPNRIRDALLQDDRILGISDLTCTGEGDTVGVSLTVHTIYGDTRTQLELNEMG